MPRPLHREGRVPEPVEQPRPRGIDPIAPGQRPAGQGIEQQAEIALEHRPAVGVLEPEGGEGRRVATGADAELEPAA